MINHQHRRRCDGFLPHKHLPHEVALDFVGDLETCRLCLSIISCILSRWCVLANVRELHAVRRSASHVWQSGTALLQLVSTTCRWDQWRQAIGQFKSLKCHWTGCVSPIRISLMLHMKTWFANKTRKYFPVAVGFSLFLFRYLCLESAQCLLIIRIRSALLVPKLSMTISSTNTIPNFSVTNPFGNGHLTHEPEYHSSASTRL